MAMNTPTTYALDRSSGDYVRRAVAYERSSVDICHFRYGFALMDLQRALDARERNEVQIAELRERLVDAQRHLELALSRLADAEECE